MATKENNPSSGKQEPRVMHQTDIVKLQDFAYEKSGEVKGDPDVYALYLQRILNGDLVEEETKVLSEEEKNDKKEKVKQLEKDLDEVRKKNEKFEQEIETKEKKIDAHREELLKIREERDENPEKAKKEAFSPLKFGINLFILLMLTIYLFFFYVSAAYKALYTDFEQIATGMAEGLGTRSIMPSPYELSEALRFNYLLLLVPFVFYGFGWAFHIILDMKNKFKIVYLVILLALTFTVDFLLALIIHDNTEQAKMLMGLDTVHWTASTTFYIILFLGFLVYIIWSILLDSMLREWSKRQIVDNVKKIIKHMRQDIKALHNKIAPEDDLKHEIDNHREDLSTVNYGSLKRYLDQFSTGWISYLSPDNMKDIKTKCLSIKKDFESKHQIKPGTVKVISKRG